MAAIVAWSVLANAQKPVGEVFASDASVQGSVLLTGTGTSVLSGSSVVAGEAVASLRLARGGEVRICRRTSVSVSASENGNDLMLGMSSGALEAEYALPASADTIMTPDFRVLVSGPGNFHFAIGADARGNTCIRTLEHNTASLIVTEVMGQGTYQVRPGEEVLFRLGKLADHVRDAGACGCPAPAAPVLRATAAPALPAPPASAKPAAPPPAENKNDEVHVAVDAPFVYHAGDPAPELDLAPQAARLRTERTAIVLPVILPPDENPYLAAPPATEPKRATAPARFLHKLGSFFARIFK